MMMSEDTRGSFDELVSVLCVGVLKNVAGIYLVQVLSLQKLNYFCRGVEK